MEIKINATESKVRLSISGKGSTKQLINAAGLIILDLAKAVGRIEPALAQVESQECYVGLAAALCHNAYELEFDGTEIHMTAPVKKDDSDA